ncbi:serine/threonine-protein kinase Nek1-like isoform X2 [Ptychodera flava]|uniref:serine/threonine-protein kinase Nek1-like isoform X2 n=1 Tax=Ptychodera flava TaxID=63121 RepID=UPI003969E50C
MDRYEKVRQIGEGSFGKALLVKSKKDGEYKVVKEISISKMGRREREDSKKEVSVLAKMRHPNIVCYLESFEDRGNLYIVMEYCDGGDLYKVINRQRGVLLDENKILDWFVQICLAIKHVHDRKILHRDIKSQNIFLTRAGMIKLGDFGIAKVLNSTVELARTCIGTPYYLSPEICENKPYNNKSDIWALGCVLYELCTLKHAFEAGNMKNLVLKIIRGSYPPLSPKYSYELRNLQASLLKRSARDRPSVNTVLKKPFLQKRIEQFLSGTKMADEFSHTVLHRNRPALAARPPVQAAARKPPSAANPARISDPAAKYGVSVAKKKPPSNRGQAKRSGEKPPKAVPSDNKELERKKKELVEKENLRREKERQIRIGHQQLMEKQRMARMKKARQEGWRNLLDSGSSGSSAGGGGGGGSANSDNNKPFEIPKRDPVPHPNIPKDKRYPERGQYDHYHRYLDDLQKGKALRADDPVQAWPDRDAVQRQIQKRPVSASAANAAKRAEANSVMGAQAAERARLVEDFLIRKRQAAENKARVGAQMGWLAPTPISEQPPAKKANRNNDDHSNDMKGRDEAEREYLSRLRQIRLQNFNERRQIEKQKAREGMAVRRSIEGDPKYNADVRKQKIEALRQQADERAAKLKDELERKRREAYEKEKKAWEEHLAKKGVKAPPPKAEKPKPARKPIPVAPKGPAVPVVGLTAAFKQAGIEPETAIETEPPKEEPKQAEPKSVLQQQKDEILKRLNEQKHAPDRKKWGEGDAAKGQLPFANLPLEETSSVMEATGAGDVVIKNPGIKPSAAAGGDNVGVAPRKGWGGPSSTVMNALQKAAIAETITISKDETDAAKSKATEGVAAASVPTVKTPSPTGAIGETITIDKSPRPAPTAAVGETITIDKTPKPGAATPISETITLDDKPKPEIAKRPPTITEDEAGEVEETVEIPEGDKAKKDGVPSSVKDAWGKSGKKDDDKKPGKDDGGSQAKKPEDSSSDAGKEKKPVKDDKQNVTSKEEKNKDDEKDLCEEELSVEAAPAPVQTSGPLGNHPEKDSPETEPDVESSPVKGSPKTPPNTPDQGSSDEGSPKLTVKKLSPDSLAKSASAIGAAVGGENGTAEVSSPASVSPTHGIDREDSVEQDKQQLEEEYKALMNQVELDSEEDDEKDEPSFYKEAQNSGVVKGLQTGFFDADVRLLRTCSEPDLSKLFKTNMALNPFFEVERMSLDVNLEDIEDGEDELDRKQDGEEGDASGNQEEDDENGDESDDDDDADDEDDEEDDGVDDDEDDMASIRQSYRDILDDDDDEVASPGSRTVVPRSDSSTSQDDRTPTSPESPRESNGIPGRKKSSTGDSDNLTEEDGAVGADPEVLANWDSGSGESDDEAAHSDDDRESVFSRLEESRVQLEEELGCDQFMQAYRSIQAIHEDEDENIQDGIKAISSILGADKQHLYPQILQLVMADGAFTEDND